MKKLHKTSAKSGFTMVELSLAMAFIAMLLIAIAIMTTSLVSIYRKGLSIKAVNSVGRNLIDEFTRAINLAPSVDTTSLCNSLAPYGVIKCESNHAFQYVFQEQRSTPDANGNSKQYNGVFCTGYYSYIWNTQTGISDNKTMNLVYLDESGKKQISVIPHLARVVDRTHRVCSAVVDAYYDSTYPAVTEIDITHLAGDVLDNKIAPPVEDFLREFDTNLVLYDLTIFPLSQDRVTLRSFMSGTFVLATERGNIEILNSGDYCDPNGERNTDTSSSQLTLGSEFNYCAINKFNFAARTAGSAGV